MIQVTTYPHRLLIEMLYATVARLNGIRKIEYPFCAVEWNDEGERKNGLPYKNKRMNFFSLDNNLCERKIRSSIGWRKMLGGHRTQEGAKQYAIIQTHRQTWTHQEKYPYNELLNFIRN